MAKKNVDPLDESDEINLDEDGATLLSEAMEELKSHSSCIKLYRLSGKGKYAFVTQYDPTQWDLKTVSDEFGGGEYKVAFHDDNKRLLKIHHFSVDAHVKGRVDAPPGLPGSDPMVILRPMMDSQQASSDRMLTMMMESSKQQMVMMLGMFQVMAGGKQERNVNDPLETLVKLKTVLGEGKKENPLEMFMKGLEFGASQKSDEKPFWQDLLTAMAPALPVMLAGGRPPMPAIPSAPQPTQTPEEKMRLNEIMALQKMASRLETACRTAEPAETLVDFLITTVEGLDANNPGTLDRYLNVLDDPTWFDKLCKMNKDAVQYKDYLLKCHKLIQDEFADEETPEAEPKPVS